MRKIFLLFLFVLPVFLFAAEKFETTPGDPFDFHSFKLENGLNVIMARNTDQPKIKSYLLVRAGSMDDPEQSTGLAHYFEHMMFKGTSRIAALDWEKEKPLLDRIEELFEQYRNEKDPEKRKAIYAEIDKTSLEAAKYSNNEYEEILRSLGCDYFNAFTSYDVTAYELIFPAEMLEPVLTLEAERFSNIAMRRFHTELETVYEEFNRTQDSDTKQAVYALLKLVAGDKHPLARPVIGDPGHLKNPSIRDIRKFFEQYYVPENMVLILSGDLDYEKTAALVRKTFGALPAKKVAEKNPVPPVKLLQKPVTAEVTGPEGEFLYMAIPLKSDGEKNRYIRDLIFTVLDNGKNGIFDTNLRNKQKVQSIKSGPFFIAGNHLLTIFAKPLKGQSLEQLRALIEAELENLKKGNFDPSILTAAVNNDRFQLMKIAEDYAETADAALNLTWYRFTVKDILNDLKKTEHLTKEEFVHQANRILTSAPAVVYKRSGSKNDRVHAEKPPITPLKTPSDQVSLFSKNLAKNNSPNQRVPQHINWETDITETPVRGTKLFSTKNDKNERFSFSIVLPIGSYHDLKHELAISYLSLLGTNTKDLAAFDSELYKLALHISFDCENFTTIFTITGLQKYLPQAMALLKERITQVKDDPAVYLKLVERIGESRRNAMKNPSRLLSGAISYALYGRDCPARNELSFAEMKNLSSADLTAYLNSLCTSTPWEYVYHGPGTPDEVAALIRQILPEPAKELRKIPVPKKFKIVPPEENTVYVIRHPSTQITAMLVRPDRVQIPADTAFERMADYYVKPVFYEELREKRALSYVAHASYDVPGIMPDNYSLFSVLIGTQPDKLEQSMNTIKMLTAETPHDEHRFKRMQSAAVIDLTAQRIKPENLYFYRKNQLRLKQSPDQAEKDFERILQMDEKDFYKKIREALNRHKDIWILSGNIKDIPAGTGKIIELKPEDVIPQ